MKATNCFFITRREFPSDEKIISSKLLIKSGMIYKNENGIYSTYIGNPFRNELRRLMRG